MQRGGDCARGRQQRAGTSLLPRSSPSSERWSTPNDLQCDGEHLCAAEKKGGERRIPFWRKRGKERQGRGGGCAFWMRATGSVGSSRVANRQQINTKPRQPSNQQAPTASPPNTHKHHPPPRPPPIRVVLSPRRPPSRPSSLPPARMRVQHAAGSCQRGSAAVEPLHGRCVRPSLPGHITPSTLVCPPASGSPEFPQQHARCLIPACCQPAVAI